MLARSLAKTFRWRQPTGKLGGDFAMIPVLPAAAIVREGQQGCNSRLERGKVCAAHTRIKRSMGIVPLGSLQVALSFGEKYPPHPRCLPLRLLASIAGGQAGCQTAWSACCAGACARPRMARNSWIRERDQTGVRQRHDLNTPTYIASRTTLWHNVTSLLPIAAQRRGCIAEHLIF